MIVAPADAGDTRSPFATLPVTAVSAGVFAVLLAVATRYGYHRDELYFRMLGERPAFGYFDTPPLTPMLAKASIAVFGDTVFALRVAPALLVAATVVLVALTCRELGGGRTAQVLAAVGIAVSTMPLIAGHMLLTLTPDLALWAAAILFLLKAIRVDPRWWLAAGAVVGLATYNRQLIALLVVSVGIGIVAVGPRSVLRSRWLWLGGLLGLVLALPNLVYQFTHDWPQLQMAEALDADDGAENRIIFVPLQFGLVGGPLAVISVVGLVWLWRRRDLRFLVVAYPVACALTLYSGGRPDYVIGLLMLLYAAGCVPTGPWMRTLGRKALVGAGVVLAAVVSIVMALPVLPVSAVDDFGMAAMNEAAVESIGWPAFAAQVGEVVADLPRNDRADAVLFAENYGQAGALDRWSEEHALPPVYSGHNELWWWGAPPEDSRVVVAVTESTGFRELFASCDQHATVDDGVGSWNEEQGKPILVCRDPVRPWSELWPELRNYS